MDRERVDGALELGGKQFIHQSVTIDPALPSERFRHDIEPEVSLAAGAIAGMSLVPVGLIDDVESLRRQSLGQLLRDEIAGAHVRGVSLRVLLALALAGSRGQCR